MIILPPNNLIFIKVIPISSSSSISTIIIIIIIAYNSLMNDSTNEGFVALHHIANWLSCCLDMYVKQWWTR